MVDDPGPDVAPAAVVLTEIERRMLAGAEGPGVAMAMRVVTSLARVRGAERLMEINSAHVDGCLYHGRAGLDFAQRLVGLEAEVRVPTTLNVGSLDLLHPSVVLRRTPAEQEVATSGRELMDAYLALGARPTWTCAPYQLDSRPSEGEHIAWAESNAIVFANSVLGARTDRYGDFLDICAAITGRAPYAGLHLDEARRGDLIIDCTALAGRFDSDLVYPLLGYLAGHAAGTGNPVLVGLPTDTDEDQLKALGAAAASAGGVALFHAVGVTPEAPTLAAVTGDREVPRMTLTPADLRRARTELSTARGDQLDAVSLGTPHASLAEIEAVAALLADGTALDPAVDVYLSTGRSVLAAAEERGLVAVLETAGVQLLVDTCTYVTSVLAPGTEVVMTNSGKWAHYAPGNLGVDVVLGSLAECLDSARAGRIRLDDRLLG
ncbi:MAG: aconitase X [Propionibacteriaceae bacterium]